MDRLVSNVTFRSKRFSKGRVRYELKTPYRDGMTHVVFAPAHVAMSWAQRLKRVFNIDMKTCRVCGGSAKVIACIEDPAVISKILNHLQEQSTPDSGVLIPHPRAPPQAGLFD